MKTLSTDGKKGITVKIDAELHAEVKQYLESHDMTMAEFVTLALDDELHPKFNQKEEKNMGNMRTIAFQVPEDLFYKIKDYLQRNNMTQKDFMLGLIEDELSREQAERETADETDELTEQEESASEDDFEAVSKLTEGNTEEEEYGDISEDSDGEDESEDEEETAGFSMGMWGA